MLALSISASVAIADKTANYNSATGVLELSGVSIDGGKDTYSIKLQNKELLLGGYLFELDLTTVTLNEPPVDSGVPQVTYKIGDTGPGGGIVFYIGDDRSSGLEAALTDAGTSEWGCVVRDVIDNGTGKSNTDAIIAAECGEYTAAKLARNYIWPNGQRDGFLPNRDELNHLYGQIDVVGGFSNLFYWSSSKYSSTRAWAQLFNDGNTFNGRQFLGGTSFNIGSQNFSSKSKSHLVRAVRSF